MSLAVAHSASVGWSPRCRWISGTAFQHGPSSRGMWIVMSPRSSRAVSVAPRSPPLARACSRLRENSSGGPNSRPMRMAIGPLLGGRTWCSCGRIGLADDAQAREEPIEEGQAAKDREADDHQQQDHARRRRPAGQARPLWTERTLGEPDGERVAVDAHLAAIVERDEDQVILFLGRQQRAWLLALAHQHGMVAVAVGQRGRLEAAGAAKGKRHQLVRLHAAMVAAAVVGLIRRAGLHGVPRAWAPGARWTPR